MSGTVPITRRRIVLQSQTPTFERVNGPVDPPIEISRSRLPGLNMVDETIIIRSSLKRKDGDRS